MEQGISVPRGRGKPCAFLIYVFAKIISTNTTKCLALPYIYGLAMKQKNTTKVNKIHKKKGKKYVTIYPLTPERLAWYLSPIHQDTHQLSSRTTSTEVSLPHEAKSS